MAEYSIEICGPHDEYVIFAPTQTRLRGRFDSKNTAHRDKSDLMKQIVLAAPVIPGKILHLDTEKKTGRVIDPLGFGEGAAILARINDIAREHSGQMPVSQAHPPETHKLTVDQVKDWAYWMRRLLDSGYAVAAPGSTQLPPLDEIRAWPGKRLADPFNTQPQTLKAPPTEDQQFGLYRYTDEVPLDPPAARGRKEPATA